MTYTSPSRRLRMHARIALGLVGLAAVQVAGGKGAPELEQGFYSRLCRTQEGGCAVPIEAVLANPDAFIGRRVSITGFLRYSDDRPVLFPSADAATYWRNEAAIAIESRDSSAALSDRDIIEDGYVWVVGLLESVPDDDKYQFLLRIIVDRPVRRAAIVHDKPPDQ